MTVSLLAGTSEILRWQNEIRPNIQRADWLTSPLVDAGILPNEFMHSRVAPVVIGVALSRMNNNSGVMEGKVKASADLDYLRASPGTEFNPHSKLKNSVRSTLERDATRKKPDIALFPGYVFPDVFDGSMYLDDTLSDGTCTSARFAPAAGVLSSSYRIPNIFVGTEALVHNDYGFSPDFALPSVIREALKPHTKGGKIKADTTLFRDAAKTIRMLQSKA